MQNKLKQTFQVNRISGPPGPGNSEVVAGRITEDTVDFDTHGCFSPQGVYTVPVAGTYQVTSGQKSEVVYKRAGDTINIVSDWIKYDHGFYRREGKFYTVQIDKGVYNKHEGIWESLLPTGLIYSKAAKILFSPNVYVSSNSNYITITIPIIGAT